MGNKTHDTGALRHGMTVEGGLPLETQFGILDAYEEQAREIERLKRAVASWSREESIEAARAEKAEAERDEARADKDAAVRGCHQRAEIIREELIKERDALKGRLGEVRDEACAEPCSRNCCSYHIRREIDALFTDAPQQGDTPDREADDERPTCFRCGRRYYTDYGCPSGCGDDREADDE